MIELDHKGEGEVGRGGGSPSETSRVPNAQALTLAAGGTLKWRHAAARRSEIAQSGKTLSLRTGQALQVEPTQTKQVKVKAKASADIAHFLSLPCSPSPLFLARVQENACTRMEIFFPLSLSLCLSQSFSLSLGIDAPERLAGGGSR